MACDDHRHDTGIGYQRTYYFTPLEEEVFIMPFYAQEILLGLIGFAAAIIPLLLPSLRPLYRFILVAGGVCVACMISGFVAGLFYQCVPDDFLSTKYRCENGR